VCVSGANQVQLLIVLESFSCHDGELLPHAPSWRLEEGRCCGLQTWLHRQQVGNVRVLRSQPGITQCVHRQREQTCS